MEFEDCCAQQTMICKKDIIFEDLLIIIYRFFGQGRQFGLKNNQCHFENFKVLKFQFIANSRDFERTKL